MKRTTKRKKPSHPVDDPNSHSPWMIGPASEIFDEDDEYLDEDELAVMVGVDPKAFHNTDDE